MTIITHNRPTHDISSKSHRTLMATEHQVDNSYLILIKMIAKLENDTLYRIPKQGINSEPPQTIGASMNIESTAKKHGIITESSQNHREEVGL